MMNKIAKFEKSYIIVVATVSGFLGSSFTNYLGNKLASSTISFTIIAAILITTVVVADRLLSAVIEMSSTVRQLICGTDFIEGWWYDMTSTEDKKGIHHLVIFKIYFENGSIKLSGQSLGSDGRIRATFRSRCALYKDRVLLVEYESSGDLIGQKVEVGIISLHFALPTFSYTGFYFDYTGSIGAHVAGRKLTSKEIREVLSSGLCSKPQSLVIQSLLRRDHGALSQIVNPKVRSNSVTQENTDHPL